MKNKIKYIYLFLFIFWMGFIIYNSSQTADLSMDATYFFTDALNKWFHTAFFNSDLFITIFRKTAHFVEYFILGGLGYITCQSFLEMRVKIKWILLGFCVLFAISDEVHQLFVSGRAFKLLDIAIDSIGSFTAVTIISKFFVQFKH